MTKKSLNKRIIGLVIWTTVAWVAKMASTQEGKKKLNTRKDKTLWVVQWTLDFIQWGLNELKKRKG